MLRLLVGLGNPGARYRGTRHNVGFDIVERLAGAAGTPWDWASHDAVAKDVVLAGVPVILMKPLTYMNLSGGAVSRLAESRGLSASEILVYLDDVSLSLGRIRIRERGSAGGHRGLESILDAVGSKEVPRFRFGVGSQDPPLDLAEFVLAPFSKVETPVFERTLDVAVDATSAILQEGMPKAMSRFNAVVG